MKLLLIGTAKTPTLNTQVRKGVRVGLIRGGKSVRVMCVRGGKSVRVGLIRGGKSVRVGLIKRARGINKACAWD